MSKAFVKESDNNQEDDELLKLPPIPAGSKNYITPRGAKKLTDELRHLLHTERPKLTEVIAWAAGNGDRSENADYIYGKRRLREIDRRIRFLEKRIEAFDVIDPASIRSDIILFGATVTVCDEEGNEKTYSIVGIDESEASRGHISWISPLARALLKSKKGDVVTFPSPKGIREIEVIKIVYEEIK
ncbi:MAG TPA: transcription elongation factor GreB [Deltaproteobacteria bacterium]|nr:MAG: transcription elongation factor GreB [Deltaproteobacteria bacterium GWA2_45_12]HBF12025.1 transcription elongation factor GreB [Deltaproteobacteria bacterium]